MTLFFASCSCQPWNQAGKHTSGCPMDPKCPFCRLSPRMCKLIDKKCTGIAKTNPAFANVVKARNDIREKISNKYNDLIVMINFLVNLGGVDRQFQKKIDALKATFNAIISKSLPTPSDLEEAEKILLQLRRIYITQKAAYETKLKEDEKAALEECAAKDFMPGRMND